MGRVAHQLGVLFTEPLAGNLVVHAVLHVAARELFAHELDGLLRQEHSLGVVLLGGADGQDLFFRAELGLEHGGGARGAWGCCCFRQANLFLKTLVPRVHDLKGWFWMGRPQIAPPHIHKPSEEERVSQNESHYLLQATKCDAWLILFICILMNRDECIQYANQEKQVSAVDILRGFDGHLTVKKGEQSTRVCECNTAHATQPLQLHISAARHGRIPVRRRAMPDRGAAETVDPLFLCLE